jgi:L-2-hydroxyglutarate oxidase LhgO
MVEYCQDHDVPFRMCGKLVVATDESELRGLETLRARGEANGLAGVELVDEKGISAIEPAVRGLRGLWVPEAGIVDYRQVARAIEAELQSARVELRFGARLVGIEVDTESVLLRTSVGAITAEYAIACAGLHSDRIALMAGASATPKIVPFRGDYYVLRPERASLIRGLVYRVPDPRFPFLGVHFSRQLDGEVWLGPNAVLAFAREGYRRTDVDLGELADAVGYSGFRSLAARFWRTGLDELVRDFWKPKFLAELRRYVPEMRSDDLLPGPSGVRAQALDASGRLLDDFVFDVAGRLLNVRNAPSPAATSSLALAREFVERLESRPGDPAPLNASERP